VDLRALQRPLKERYRQEPDAARFTLRAAAGEADNPMACSVDLGRAIYQAQAHTGVGGAGAARAPSSRSPEHAAALAEKTERYCTVFQTLTQPPPIRTSWREEGVR
jgi:hypothetical protein